MFSIPVQLLYSHLNPFFYLLVLKKFQQHHVRIAMTVWHKFWYKKVKENESSEEVSEKIFSYRNLSLISKWLMPPMFFASFILCLVSILLSVATECRNLQEAHLSSMMKTKTIKGAKVAYSVDELDILIERTSFLDIRDFCGAQSGVMSYENERCFFLKNHRPNSFDFESQIEFCENENAVLCYPRTHEEMKFMWSIVENWLENFQILDSSEFDNTSMSDGISIVENYFEQLKESFGANDALLNMMLQNFYVNSAVFKYIQKAQLHCNFCHVKGHSMFFGEL